MADPSGRPQSSGVARRRRERRLRSMLRHERMTVAMALAEFSHHSSRGQRMARAGVWGHELNYTAKIRKPPTPQPELFSLEEEPGGGLPAPLSEVAGRQEKVGAARLGRSRLPSARSCRSSIFLCRIGWTIWRSSGTSRKMCWTPVDSWIARFPSWLSKCPRSASTSFLSALWFLSHSWRNSWWKYRRLCHFPRCSGLWSRPWTFQFRRVVEVVSVSEVFKVSQDRVLQRIVEQIFQQRLPSRTLTFQFRVVTELFFLHRHLPFCR